MPRLIDGVSYFSAAEVLTELNISRQTLWRWRRAGGVPVGNRYRGKEILFTQSEFQAIREYANRLEPARLERENRQLKLFNNGADVHGD